MDFLPDYAIYKPAKSGNGSGAQFKLTVKESEGNKGRVVFLEMGKQKSKDGKQMDWSPKSKLMMALQIPDLQSIIHALSLNKSYDRNKKEMNIGCELYHQKEGKGNTILKLNVNEKQPGFYMTLSYKPENETAEEKYGSKRAIGIPITPEESTGLKIVLTQALIKVQCWD